MLRHLFIPRRGFSSKHVAYFGQPSFETHPHIVLQPNHLVRGIAKDEFARRRKSLADHFPNHSLIFVSAADRKSSHDTEIKFLQDSTFSYLFGFHEPGAAAVLKPDGKWYLFCRDSDPVREMWDGPRCGVQRAASAFGAEKAFAIDIITKNNNEFLDVVGDPKKAVIVSSDDIFQNHIDLRILQKIKERLGVLVDQPPEILKQEVSDPKDESMNPKPRSVLEACDELRLVKSSSEITCIEEAGTVTIDAFNRLQLGSYNNMRTEQHIKADLESQFYRHPATDGPYFNTIVASGARACTLHYTACDLPLELNQLVLVDFGARLKNGYGADCTRTFWTRRPSYNTAQQIVVDVVQDVQNSVLKSVSAGKSLVDLQKRTIDAFVDHFEHTLGLVNKDMVYADKVSKVRRYFPHGVSHFIGLDVHDTPTVKRDRKLPANSVITIEPGLYFPVNDLALPSYLRGIGVRIEDTVVVNENSCCTIVTRTKDDQDLTFSRKNF